MRLNWHKNKENVSFVQFKTRWPDVLLIKKKMIYFTLYRVYFDKANCFSLNTRNRFWKIKICPKKKCRGYNTAHSKHICCLENVVWKTFEKKTGEYVEIRNPIITDPGRICVRNRRRPGSSDRRVFSAVFASFSDTFFVYLKSTAYSPSGAHPMTVRFFVGNIRFRRQL